MKVIEVYSEIGSIRIYNETTAFYFSNRFGDFPNKVIICESEEKREQAKSIKQVKHINQQLEFSVFDIYTKAYLSKHDYAETPVYEFKPGHYEVNLYESLTFLICWHPPRPKVKPYDDPDNLASLPQVSLTQSQN